MMFPYKTDRKRPEKETNSNEMEKTSSPFPVVQTAIRRKEEAISGIQPLLHGGVNPFVSPGAFGNLAMMMPGFAPGYPHLGYAPALMNPFMGSGHHLTANGERRGEKHERPFKQFANELLYGIHHLVPSKSVLAPPSAAKPRPLSAEGSSPKRRRSDEGTSPNYTGEDPKEDSRNPGDSNSSFSDAASGGQPPPDTSCGGQKRRSLPDHLKTDLYWEKRRKNNAAAKRSRDARREKEDMLAMAAKTMHDSNCQLQMMVSSLSEQKARADAEVQRLKEQQQAMQIEIYRLKEENARLRRLCRSCGDRISDAELSGNGL